MTAPDDPAAVCALFSAVLLRLVEGCDEGEGDVASSICVLFVNTRFESFLSVCVKFLDASAKAGLLALSNCSEADSEEGESSAMVVIDGAGAGGGTDKVDGFGLIIMLVDGR